MNRTRVVIFAGLLIAMYIILNYWLSIPLTPTIIVKFGFLPLSIMSMLVGPFFSGAAAAVGDVIGATSFPQGPFFLGFTVSAFVTGVIYGLFLYKKPKTMLRITLAVLCVTLFVDFGLNTYWLTLLYGKGFFVLLPGRVAKSLLMLPVQVTVIYTVWRYAGDLIEKRYFIEKI
jgi:ECF transporter S component (folate family)